MSATTKVAAMFAGVQIATAGIFAGLAHMSAGFEEVGYQLRLVAPAINKFLILRQAMISAYQAAGINLTKAVQQSILFNYSLAKTKFALEAVYRSVGLKFIPLLTKQMDEFRAKIFANMPQIQKVLTGVVSTLLKAFYITIQLGGRAWDILETVWGYLKRLDEATSGWSTKVLGMIAVWKLLNLSFLATPLGMILTGLVGIIALYDDFKVWQEGGRSFFNWGSDASKIVLGLLKVLGKFVAYSAVVIGVMKLITAAQWAWNVSLLSNPIAWMIGLGIILLGVLGKIADKFGLLNGLKGWLKGQGSDVLDLLGGAGPAVAGVLGGSNADANFANIVNPQPLMTTPNSSQSINQKTEINVNTTADAEKTANIVLGGQNQTNRDLVRNFAKGVQ
jgi:hypothetical protein